MRTGIAPRGLRIKKPPAFEPTNRDFDIKFN